MCVKTEHDRRADIISSSESLGDLVSGIVAGCTGYYLSGRVGSEELSDALDHDDCFSSPGAKQVNRSQVRCTKPKDRSEK